MAESGTPYPTHPPKTPFFPDFSLISGVSPIKSTYNWDFWGPGGGGKFPCFFPEFTLNLCVWGLAIALTYPRRQKKGEKIAPWSHFFANFSNIPPDPEKFKGRSRIGVGGAKFSDANLRHFSREKWGRGFGILVNLGVDIIPGPFFPKFGGGRGGAGGVWGGKFDEIWGKFGVNLGVFLRIF